ncbi:MAG: DoxX family protein [Ferruginibacter sp.]
MKKLLSVKYTPGAFNTAMLVLRLTLGIMIMHHGYEKLTNFNQTAGFMPSLFGMSNTISAALVIFAEFFCGLFVVIGLFTRLATIPIIITLCVALFKVHNAHVFAEGERAVIYIGGFIVLLLVGAGRVSIDGMTGK